MNAINFLKPLIGEEKTLVITCMECCYDLEEDGHGMVFRYTTLGNMLNPEDTTQQDSLRSFINFKGCSRIIVAGHHHCKALHYIRCELSSDSPIQNLQADLRTLFGNNHGSLMNGSARENMIVQLNVIDQCKRLLTYPFIKKRFEEGALSIFGVVINTKGDYRHVFTNGIAYNDMISLN